MDTCVYYRYTFLLRAPAAANLCTCYSIFVRGGARRKNFQININDALELAGESYIIYVSLLRKGPMPVFNIIS